MQHHAGYPEFRGWDVGPRRIPYCCTFHWFRAADGRILGIDVIRSSDIDQLSLRAYLVNAGGAIKGLAYAAPTAAWESFATDSRPPLGGAKPSLGRGVNWIAGSLHTTGWVELDGTRFDIDSDGPVSIHFGAHLPSYGYRVTVHDRSRPDAPGLLLGSVAGDDFRVIDRYVKDITLTYAYGAHGVPRRMFNIGRFKRRSIPLNLFGRLELSAVQPFTHLMLDVKAITASAKAILHLPFGKSIALGDVILDFRGRPYVDTLL